MEEDKRLKLPANWEAKKSRLEWELKVEEKKKVIFIWIINLCPSEWCILIPIPVFHPTSAPKHALDLSYLSSF